MHIFNFKNLNMLSTCLESWQALDCLLNKARSNSLTHKHTHAHRAVSACQEEFHA